ncbi:MAG: hypothetical protein WBZ36_03915 [Candidatus Nitrosopolaris sp.]
MIEEKSAYFKNLKTNDLQEEKSLRADVNDKSIVLTNIKGKLYAIDSVVLMKGNLRRRYLDLSMSPKNI